MYIRLLLASLLLVTPAFAETEEEVVATRTYTESYTETTSGTTVITTEGDIFEVSSSTESNSVVLTLIENDNPLEDLVTQVALLGDNEALEEYDTVVIYPEGYIALYEVENDALEADLESSESLSGYERTIYVEEDDEAHERMLEDDPLSQWEQRKKKWT